jgi:phytoene synthase
MGSNLAAAITRGSHSSFFYSFSFLPREQREAIRTLYAFCRETDDIVDTERDPKRKVVMLRKWRMELGKALEGRSTYLLLNQLSETAKRFNIPIGHFHELIRGVEMDLTVNRYHTFDELRIYCYRVASSVGLMCLEIFRPRNQQTREYAINLGIALQLTNILRDVKADAKHGRIYIPLEDVRKFGCTEEDILEHRYTPEFAALMEFECARAEEYFSKARVFLSPEDKRAMFAAKIMERIYYHTLLRIKKYRYNVFEKSSRLPSFLQFLIAVKYWLIRHGIPLPSH